MQGLPGWMDVANTRHTCMDEWMVGANERYTWMSCLRWEDCGTWFARSLNLSNGTPTGIDLSFTFLKQKKVFNVFHGPAAASL